MEMFQVVLAGFWLIAGVVSFYFSIGNARVWTSISVGFFLILLGEIIPGALPFLPGLDNPYVLVLGHIIGTISILACCAPARWACRLDPAEVLRNE